MKSIQCILALFLFNSGLKAQNKYFLYFQSEDDRPFYVKWKDKVYSSSETGYLIMPEVKPDNYSVVIGFPKNEMPSENFNLEIKEKDKGFLIKRISQLQYNLYDMQSKQLIQPVVDTELIILDTIKEALKNKPSFSEALAQAVGDTADVISKSKYYSENNSSGMLMKYKVSEESTNDTVDVYIEYNKKIESGFQETKKDTFITAYNCIKQASQSDVIQLRKKMIAEDNDEAMLAIAFEGLKNNCYDVSQLKNIVVLLLKDDNRLELLKRAYNLVVNKGEYPSLISVLVEEKNIIQFKSIIQ